MISADDTEIVTYQSFCNPLMNNGECSNNFNCSCLVTVPTGERICALQIECSSAMLCRSNGNCDQPNSICVIDNRCNDQRICYPIASTNPDICPPIATNDKINDEK